MLVWEVGLLRIHLPKVNLDTQTGSPQMSATPHQHSNIDPPQFRSREQLLVGQRRKAHRASHVEDALRLKAPEIALDVVTDRTALVVVERPAVAHRIEIDTSVVERAGSNAFAVELRSIAARHAV